MKNFYNCIIRISKPFIIWFGHLHVPFSHKKVNGKHYFLLRDNLNIGDVMLTTINGEFSNLINPEKIKHGAIYVGDINGDGIRYVVESTGKGVVLKDLVTFLTTKDLVVGTRLLKFNIGMDVQLQKNAMKYIGKSYDYQFDDDNDNYYCFELVAKILKDTVKDADIREYEVVKDKFIYSYKTFLNDESFITTFNTKEMKV